MIFVALALLGLGVCDLVRWSPDRVRAARAVVAALSGAATVIAVAALSGMAAASVALAGAVALAVLSAWSAYDPIQSQRAKPEYALVFVVGFAGFLVAVSGAADPVGGDLAVWYSNLGFGFARGIPVDQFVLGVGGACFLLATGNRIVRFTLVATEASLLEGEGTMRGGRVLGPMERLIVAAAVVSGGVAAAGFVIAAKGLLRFREIRDADRTGVPGRREQVPQPKADEVTEYFLIGTFTSVILAAGVSVLVLAGA
jgi:hypothetical protein